MLYLKLHVSRFYSCLAFAWLPLVVAAGSVATAETATSAGTTARQSTSELVLLPGDLRLPSTESRQRLVAQWRAGDQFLGQARSATYRSSDEKVVRIEDGVAVPVNNGQAMITAEQSGHVASATVTVTGQEEPHTWSFRNHVESVLSKSGCNGGACHGARAGQKGFRLTLFGFDVEADHAYLTRQARGRRIVPTDPGRSLILTKATGLIPHKGGVRFDPQSLEYRVLAEWIAQGAPPASDQDPLIERLEVLPSDSLQETGAEQQLLVRAHFSDGHVEDVTRWAKYTSLNSSVANVSDRGLVEITGEGEAAIKVWYLNINQLASVRVPFAVDANRNELAGAQHSNFIDGLILEKLASLNIPPSPVCDDPTFIRRLYLDTIGVLPTADEVERFLNDPAPDKRNRLIDELLARPEFVDYWAYKWSDLLLVSSQHLRPDAVNAYYKWVHEQVARNTPWDEFVRQLVTASGSTLENGAANFYAIHQSPDLMAETVSQAFLGLSINCAKCHNHPLEKWTNDQYYAFANLFARVQAKGWGGNAAAGDGNRIIFADVRGDLIQPSTGRPQPPQPLDGEAIPLDSPDDRRLALSDWLTSPENPYFTRSITNRVWANFFSVGLVETVDDMRLTNPASNEELLTALSRYLVENRYDLRQLMRLILQSSAYQRSSFATELNAEDERHYARYYPRRLPAEVMLDAISHVTGVPTEFASYPKGTRALELPESGVESYFLSTFGRPERIITCDCERSDEPSMTQALHLLNGDTVNQKLRAEGNRVAQLLDQGLPAKQMVEELYLSSLSRYPTAEELDQLLSLLQDAPSDERRQAWEDLFWSVLTSREFLFNH